MSEQDIKKMACEFASKQLQDALNKSGADNTETTSGDSCQEIKNKVFELVAEHLGAPLEKISDDTSFINDLGADSLDIVELVMDLEDKFNIKIPEDIADKIQTVGDAVKFIAAQSANN